MTIKQQLQRRRLERLEKRLIAPPRATGCDVEVISHGQTIRRHTMKPLVGYTHKVEVLPGVIVKLKYYSYAPNRCESEVFA